ncbi:MAG: Flp pilus assembly complex ATPase component TadA [Actinobacteria bacterium]|nr:Flp pilus assembly complex ATPase component TadA [Actinomycetota bacterium]
MTDPLINQPTNEASSLAGLPLLQPATEPSRVEQRFAPAVPASRLPANFLTPTQEPAGGRLRRAHTEPPASADDDLSTSTDQVDWRLVREIRAAATEQLSEQRVAATANGEPFDPDRELDAGRQIVDELLQEHATNTLRAGEGRPLDIRQQRATAQAVHDALFGMGRLEPLRKQEQVENIEAYGFDNVLLEDQNGVLNRGPAIANSDEEMLEDLMLLASRYGRPFSEAVPELHLELDDGSRLAAVAWVTPRPTLVIRRHRLKDISLNDLVERRTLSPNLASFLAAVIRSGRSVVVAGAQGAGKTTLVRGLCNEIPPWEKIGTFETERELGLDQMPDRHPRVVAFEARPGSGEYTADGRRAGEITLRQLFKTSYRLILDRYIVGEVRGDEILEMIEAMEAGQGTISTTHSRSAKATLAKLITCAMKAGPNISEAYATKALAEHIDVILYIKRDQTPLAPGQAGFALRQRYVSQVVSLGWNPNGPDFTDIYVPGSDGRAHPNVLPEYLEDLAEYGFESDQFHQEAS